MEEDFLLEDESSLDTTNAITSTDFSNLLEKIDYQNDLIVVGDIFLVSILVFLAFKNALKGLWK